MFLTFKIKIMEKILTAEEFYLNPNAYITKMMIEFAKLHVKAALEAASKSATYYEDTSMGFEIDPNSILNSYPDNLIQ